MKTSLALGLILLASPVFATPQVFPSRDIHKPVTSTSKMIDCNPRQPDACLRPNTARFYQPDYR